MAVNIKNNNFIVCAFALFLIVFVMVGSSQAYTFYIDNFSVTRDNGSGTSYQIFNDSFSDGNPPPSAPDYLGGTPALYYVFGTMGPEQGSKLTLDSSGALPTTGSNGNPYLAQATILETNADNANFINGLKSTHTFSVTGVFDLILPSVDHEFYGIRLTDAYTNYTPDDVVDLWVLRSLSSYYIVFLDEDFVNHTVQTIGGTTLETGHDQIALTLSKTDFNSPSIHASYAYLDGGTMGSQTTFSNTTNIFNGENYTRAGFLAGTPAPVPEPATMLLLGSGLFGLAGLRRKFKK